MLGYVAAVGEARVAETANRGGVPKHEAARRIHWLIKSGQLIRFASPSGRRGEDVVVTVQTFSERHEGRPESVAQRSALNGRASDRAVELLDGRGLLSALGRQERATQGAQARRLPRLESEWQTHGWGKAYHPGSSRPAVHWVIAARPGTSAADALDGIDEALKAEQEGRPAAEDGETRELKERLERIVFLATATPYRLAWIRLAHWITNSRRAAVICVQRHDEALRLARLKLAPQPDQRPNGGGPGTRRQTGDG